MEEIRREQSVLEILSDIDSKLMLNKIWEVELDLIFEKYRVRTIVDLVRKTQNDDTDLQILIQTGEKILQLKNERSRKTRTA